MSYEQGDDFADTARKGGSSRRAADNAKTWSEPKSNGKAGRIKLVPFGEIKLSDEPEYLVDCLIPREGIIVTYGAPKSHKTFWVFDLAMHVALGWVYRGRCVEQAPVVYCAFEGQSGFRKRCAAFKQRFLADHAGEVPFHLQPLRLDLVKDADELVTAIGDIAPGLIVLDTLNRSLVGSESKDGDMTAYLAAADKLREAFNCAVLIVHHSGLHAGRPRGHTSLTGAADAQLSVRRAGEVSTVTVEFMKDGAEGAIFTSRLEVVDLGNLTTSCVIVEAEAAAAETRTKLTKNQTTMFSILHAEARGLSVSDWNERAKEAGLGKTRAADLYDLRRALQAKHLVMEAGDRWTIKQ